LLTLWFVLFLTESLLCFLLWVLRQHRSYPAFTYFITFQVIEAFALMTLYGHDDRLYFYAYWISAAVDVVLKLGLVVELFHAIHRSHRRDAVARFYLLIAALGLFSFALSFRFPSSYPVRLMAVIRTADTGASLMLCLVFIALLLGAWWEGVKWLRRPAGIGYGLLLYLPARLLIKALTQSAGRNTVAVFNWLEMFLFLGALLVWLRTFVVPEVRLIRFSAETLRQRVREFEIIGRSLR
jgi:hypothetical protein